ncbi:MAG: hypothetical protein Q7T18_11860 [Sedimentisphaerales bacterium]|nr:hypothetical protein [Sedimentisphaerales bacterium]
MRHFSFIHTWEEAAEIGRAFRLTADESRFDLGDLVCFVCSRKNGRPSAETKDKTLSEFAREIGESRSALSQMASMSEFLPEESGREKCYEMGVGWHSMNAARIRTGWKPGEAVIEKQSVLFWDIVTKQADGVVLVKPLPPPFSLADWLSDEYLRACDAIDAAQLDRDIEVLQRVRDALGEEQSRLVPAR